MSPVPAASLRSRSLSKKDFGSLVGSLINSDLVKDEASALAMLSLVQAAYDAGKITEAQFLKAESDLVRILSFKPSMDGEGETYASNELLSLLKEREELESTLDMLADAAAAGKITQESYEKLYISNSEKLSGILSRIDAVAHEATSKDALETGKVGDLPPMSYATASPSLPVSKEISASQKASPEGKSFLSLLSSSFSLQKPHALPSRVEQLKGQVTAPRAPALAAGAENDLAQLKQDVSSLSEQLRGVQGKFESWSAKASTQSGESALSSQEMLAQFSGLSRKVADFETRIVTAESSMRDRFAQMADLVSKVSEVSGAVKLSQATARQSEDVRKQLLRTEKLADLMGRTFVNSTKKFNELEEFKHRQQIMSASLSALADSMKQLTIRMRGEQKYSSEFRAGVEALKADVEKLNASRGTTALVAQQPVKR